MNLFRRHNQKQFEKKLEEQLGELEYKPSGSLWDRIDSGLDKDGFEPAMHAKLDSFEQMPHPDTWNKIERRLPATPSRMRRFSFFGVMLVTLMVSVATGYLLITHTTQVAVTAPQKEHLSPQEQQQIDIVSKSAPKEPSSINTFETGHIGSQPGSPNTTRSSSQQFNPSTVQAQPVIAQPQLILVATPSRTKPLGKDDTQKLQAVTKTPEALTPPALANKNEEETSLPAASIPDGVVGSTIDSQSVASTSRSLKSDTTVFATGREIANGSIVKLDSSVIISSNQQPAFEDEFTRFSISVFGGASLSGTTYQSPTNSNLNFDENIKLRKEIERATIDWSGGFMLDYRLSDRWMVSSGIMMVNFNQEFYYDLDSAVSPASSADVGAPVINPGDSFLVGNTYSNRIRYTWTEIPVLVNYTLHRSQTWDIDLQGGIGYAFISTIDGGMVSYDNKGVLVLKDKESFPQISNTWFMTFQPQISKKFAQGVSVGIVPSFKYSITSIIGNETWIQQHPYFFGLSACLRKRF